MQNSRLSRLGKSTLTTKSQFTLLQEISVPEFDSDRPLQASTAYLDENNMELSTVVSGMMPIGSNKDIQGTDKGSDSGLFAMSKITSSEGLEVRSAKIRRGTGDPYRGGLDAIKEETQTGTYYKPKNKSSRLLAINKPKAFARKQKFDEIDFIGGDLAQVEDILGDISKIMEQSSKRSIVQARKEPQPNLNNKWLKNHMGGMSKLQEMLRSYKSTPDDFQASLPIVQQFYKSGKQSQKSVTPKSNAKKQESFGFPKVKTSDAHKLSIVMVKWAQMPMISTSWEPEIFLKIQSYPQQDQYRKVLFKAYSLGVRSYSIFHYADAGITGAKQSNDKNPSRKLMSEQQFAKTWQQRLVNGDKLTEEQKQVLLEFDIEWYRTIVELCFHSGLEDVLQKQYDINAYTGVMDSLTRDEDLSGELIIQNQLKYLRAYFERVYAYTSNETLVAVIRIHNDEKVPLQQIFDSFDQMLNNKKHQFAVWPLAEDHSSLAVVLPILGDRQRWEFDSANLVEASRLRLRVGRDPFYVIDLIENGENRSEKPESAPEEQEKVKIVLRNSQEEDWKVLMKLEPGRQAKNQYSLVASEELLFGTIYTIECKTRQK